MPAPPGATRTAGARLIEQGGKKQPPDHGEGAPPQAPLVNDAAAKLQVPDQSTTATKQKAARHAEPVNVWAHGYLVVGTRGRCRLVLVVPACVFCGRPHAHNGRPDFVVGRRTASCHEGRYVVHVGTVEGLVAA